MTPSEMHLTDQVFFQLTFFLFFIVFAVNFLCDISKIPNSLCFSTCQCQLTSNKKDRRALPCALPPCFTIDNNVGRQVNCHFIDKKSACVPRETNGHNRRCHVKNLEMQHYIFITIGACNGFLKSCNDVNYMNIGKFVKLF